MSDECDSVTVMMCEGILNKGMNASLRNSSLSMGVMQSVAF